MKESIIIVGDFNRSDFLYAASVLKEKYRIFFAEYTLKSEVLSLEYKTYGEAIFWSDFRSAQDLLYKIKPSRLLFYFIETYNHVALNVACKVAGIPTYHIEHGIRSHEFLKIDFSTPPVGIGKKIKNYLGKLKTLGARMKGRRFFSGTVKKLPGEQADFLRSYFATRKQESIARTFELIKSEWRLADKYISFSPKIFEFHEINDHLAPGYPVVFTGCPAFDYLADVKVKNVAHSILFIDNAFEAQSLFGWNDNNKRAFLTRLIDFSESTGKKLLIKMHPYSNRSLYQEVVSGRDAVLISNEGFVDAVMDSSLVIGFYSTLMMPLMAMHHTVCISLEMHPTPPSIILSSFLTRTGASTQVSSWDEFHSLYADIEKVYQEQLGAKDKFTKDWLYKFDGKATERLVAAIVG